MHQEKKRESINGRNRSAWPTSVRAVSLFAPSDGRFADVVVHFLDYSIFAALQITSIAQAPLSVTDLIVNGEFRPSLAVGSLSDRIVSLRLPVQMCHGSSFGAVLRAPASDEVQSRCYPKKPIRVTLSTNRGDFHFEISETILREEPGVPIVYG